MRRREYQEEYYEEHYEEDLGYAPVASLSEDSRLTFVRKTYLHLFAAIVAFVLIEVAIFQMGLALPLAKMMMGSQMSWLLVLGGFIIAGYAASAVAHNAESLSTQYMALVGYVLIEALIFVPLLFIANAFAPGVIGSAAAVTLVGFTGLTGIAVVTGKDFSFLGGLLYWGMLGALLLIVGGLIFGFHLGLYFSVGMVVLAGGAILYSTSQALHHYPEDRYVAAALELFSSVALLFWYVIQIFLLSRD